MEFHLTKYGIINIVDKNQIKGTYLTESQIITFKWSIFAKEIVAWLKFVTALTPSINKKTTDPFSTYFLSSTLF